MDNDSNNPAAPARSGQATGYATVDVALAWAEGSRVLSRDEYEILQGKDGFENCRADRKASIVLAAEVRRLRAALESIRDFGAPVCPYPTEEQKDLNEIYEITLKAIGPWVAGQSHNEKLSDAHKEGAPHV